MKGSVSVACGILLTALMGGCAKDSGAPAAPADTRAAAGGTRSAANPAGDVASRRAAAPSDTTLYFAFDSDELDRQDEKVIDLWSKYLAANPDIHVTLTGHCDERGTREYNVALGERRGNAVRDRLMSNGIGAGQLAVVSYGEDRPAAAGHTEAAWAKNRRVELAVRP